MTWILIKIYQSPIFDGDGSIEAPRIVSVVFRRDRTIRMDWGWPIDWLAALSDLQHAPDAVHATSRRTIGVEGSAKERR